MIGEFKDIAMKTIQNETQKKKKILKEKWTEHRWTVEKFQVAKYTCNWSPQGEEVTEKVSEEIIYWNFSNVMNDKSTNYFQDILPVVNNFLKL